MPSVEIRIKHETSAPMHLKSYIGLPLKLAISGDLGFFRFFIEGKYSPPPLKPLKPD
jgi:hypothetical protein